MQQKMAETGLAFSGGGIRSAAFCSGVLRGLLQRNSKIDYLSCVSGGGYTGTAYLDWKYRHGNKDDPKWHQKFFDNMRERAGVMCNWQKPLQGILDTVILIAIILLVSVVMPAIMWGSYLFPLAYAIDFLFGNMLRAKDKKCKDETPTTETEESLPGNDTVERRRLTTEFGSGSFERTALFTFLAVLFVVFFLLARKSRAGISSMFNIISVLCGLLLAFTSIPYIIFSVFNFTPIWAQLLIFVFSIFVWFFFPILRLKSSFVLVVYIFAYGIYWKVFQATIHGVQYTDYLFYRLLFASGITLWFVPGLGAIQQRLVHIFNRWRLQRAFYTVDSVGPSGCRGIELYDLFLKCPRTKQRKHSSLLDNDPRPLSLRDLEGIMPQYLSNVVVNDWKISESDDELRYELLVLSPTEIERLDRRQGEEQFEHKLDPDDIKLSDAMATSAAAVDHHMGAYNESTESIKHLQIVLGLGMGASMISDVAALKRESLFLKILPFVIEVIRRVPLISFPMVHFSGGDKIWVAIGVFVFFFMTLMLTVFAVIRTGRKNPSKAEIVARWFITNISFVRFIRDMLEVVNHGPMPPPILRLSDGGHIENLGILPLLKKRLAKIVVVDGGYKSRDSEWGNSLLEALSLAREKLHCSFIGMDGRDVIEDIKEKFVFKSKGYQPRCYRFKVHYYEKENLYTEGTKVGEGEILLISPRHPDKAVQREQPVTWKEALRDIHVDLEAATWGEGPQQVADEVDDLTFCCCECFHTSKCQWLSNYLCGSFPEHITGNQFFTPRMFTAYHREGYNACAEAEAAEFFGAVNKIDVRNTSKLETAIEICSVV